MKTILYFQPATRTSAPDKLAGVEEIARTRAYRVQVVEEPPTARTVADLVSFWEPRGIIVECGGAYNDISPALFRSVPTVFLTHNPGTLGPKDLSVCHDSRETGRFAARELLAMGFTDFAFVPSRERRFWSEEREEGFRSGLRLNGRTCAVFRPSGDSVTSSEFARGLCRFLADLPRPCGIFAANDRTGTAVLAAARKCGFSVPGDFAVVGVDNYADLCEKSEPTLSSIEPDFRRGGELAALMLLAVLETKGGYEGSRYRMFHARRIVHRASTRLLARTDEAVSSALDRIAREACSGLTVDQVIAGFPGSRRTAYRRFREATGRTILDEIHAVQLARTKDLLSDPHVQLKSIADFCGFTNPNSLRKFFLRETGLTLSAWRRQHGRAEGLYKKDGF